MIIFWAFGAIYVGAICFSYAFVIWVTINDYIEQKRVDAENSALREAQLSASKAAKSAAEDSLSLLYRYEHSKWR